MLLHKRVILVEAMSSRVKTKGSALQEERRRYPTTSFRRRGYRSNHATNVWKTGCGHAVNRHTAAGRVVRFSKTAQRQRPIREFQSIPRQISLAVRVDPYASGLFMLLLPPARARSIILIMRCMC